MNKAIFVTIEFCIALSGVGRPAQARRIKRSAIRSVRIIKGDLRVWSRPSYHSHRKGVIAGGGRFPVLSIKSPRGGCSSRWYQIGQEAWVCSGWLAPSIKPPTRLDDMTWMRPMGPWVLNRNRRTMYYPSLRRLAHDNARRLRELAGFQVFGRVLFGNRALLRVADHGWVAETEVTRAPQTNLVGVDLVKGLGLPIVFALKEQVPIWTVRGTDLRPTKQSMVKYDVRRATGRTTIAGQCYYQLRSKQRRLLVACSDTTMADRPPAPPVGLPKDEPWLDLDGKARILYARKGARILRVMLVSLGNQTPGGLFRIREKRVAMTLYNRYAHHPYYLQKVPFVIFFWQGFALHAAYWHDGFGIQQSHGCLNLSPLDARWVFSFIRPRLPPGFTAVYETKTHPGSVIRLRGLSRHIKTDVVQHLAGQARRAQRNARRAARTSRGRIKPARPGTATPPQESPGMSPPKKRNGVTGGSGRSGANGDRGANGGRDANGGNGARRASSGHGSQRQAKPWLASLPHRPERSRMVAQGTTP